MESSKTEILSFDKWFGEASQNKLFWESPSKASKMGFEAGQQSKQAEIDELQIGNHHLSIMTSEAESYSEYWKYERDKLQKRIDDALMWCEKGCILKAINILKGEETK